MKRFAFRLQKVLDLRLHREKEIEMRLAAKEGECQALENQILNLRLRKKAAFDRRLDGGLNLELLVAFEHYGRRLGQDIDQKEKSLARLMMERDEIQAEFLEARKKRKVLDNIRSRKWESWRKDTKAAEVLALDDMNTRSYIRHLSGWEAKHG